MRSQSITVTVDQDDLRLGQLIWKFEKDGISLADRVLVICSDTYVDKCDTVPESGAGQEKALISVELENNQGSIKFIPVLRDNASGKKPSCPAQRMWLDANRDENFAEVVQRLSAEIKRH